MPASSFSAFLIKLFASYCCRRRRRLPTLAFKVLNGDSLEFCSQREKLALRETRVFDLAPLLIK